MTELESLRAAPAMSQRDAALFVLGELRFTLAQAKGYIRTVSAERNDGGGGIVRELEERLSEVDALRDRFRRGE